MILLDTCIAYDWLMGRLKNAGFVAQIQADGAMVSAVSVWEMAIKAGLGKLVLPDANIAGAIEAQGFSWLNINPAHAQSVLTLPRFHNDPFDRLLIAQAQVEGLTVATYDRQFLAYLPATVLV
jgi:PIN domain nuclease of toxin-antitoxin system